MTSLTEKEVFCTCVERAAMPSPAKNSTLQLYKSVVDHFLRDRTAHRPTYSRVVKGLGSEPLFLCMSSARDVTSVTVKEEPETSKSG